MSEPRHISECIHEWLDDYATHSVQAEPNTTTQGEVA